MHGGFICDLSERKFCQRTEGFWIVLLRFDDRLFEPLGEWRSEPRPCCVSRRAHRTDFPAAPWFARCDRRKTRPTLASTLE